MTSSLNMAHEELMIFSWLKLVFIALVGLVFVLNMVVLLWWRPRKIEDHFSRQGIRGPPYRFFIGNVKELVAMMLKASSQPMPNFSHNILPRVLSFYHHWKKIYGATFLVWFGPTGRLTVSDPDLIREIFTSKSEFYEKNEAHPLIRQLEGDGLPKPQRRKMGSPQENHRPHFSHGESQSKHGVQALIPVMAKSVVEMLENWSSMLSSSGEVEIEVSECFQTLTEEVITRTAFRSSYEDGKAIFKLQTQQMVLASDIFQKVFVPGYRFLPTKRNINSWKLDKEIKRSLMKLIERRKEEISRKGRNSDDEVNDKTVKMMRSSSSTTATTSSSLSSSPKDLLGLMIEASGRSSMITAQDMVEECKSFFFAGKQTTSNLLTWTTVLLAMHPQWQVRARDEVLRVCGARDIPTKDDVVKLKTLSMILNESLRLYPPTIATIRRAKTDVELGGYKIPRGTELLIPIVAVHHDQATWGNDANEFNPARFADGVARAAKHPGAFIPFGLGVRTCIGQNLAVLHAKLALAIILQRFRFRLAPTYQHAPTVLMLLYPQHGAPIIFQPFDHNDDVAEMDPTGPQDQGQ